MMAKRQWEDAARHCPLPRMARRRAEGGTCCTDLIGHALAQQRRMVADLLQHCVAPAAATNAELCNKQDSLSI